MNARTRRPLPEVEEDIPLDHGVGPTAETKLPAVPEPVESLPSEQEPKIGVIVDRPTELFESPSGPEFKPAPEGIGEEEERAHYERIVRDAHAAHESAQQRADRYLALSAGQALREIRGKRLYESLGYQTFEEYTDNHLEISRMHVYRLIRGVRVYLALPKVHELSFRQKDVLGRAKDAEAIQAVWDKASAAGDTSPSGLKAARDELAIELAPTDKPGSPEAGAAPAVTLPKVRKALEKFFNVEALERVAASAKKPEDVEEIAAALEVAAAKLREAAGH
ncbi:hypothetical protein ACFOY2_45815 [Nonomuraea purpurea]|uniref:Uncharacterized protein n=1 Tax=Nonomuraea purpurea TaxID=1849276 RepID=A0ABV8GQZ2_9ACTN